MKRAYLLTESLGLPEILLFEYIDSFQAGDVSDWVPFREWFSSVWSERSNSYGKETNEGLVYTARYTNCRIIEFKLLWCTNTFIYMKV